MHTTHRNRGKVIDGDRAHWFWFDSTIFGKKHIPADKDDFGAPNTVGLCVKRRDVDFPDAEEIDFGTFLGNHDGIWVVAIINFDGKFLEGEEFTSLEKLKQVWTLD